VLACMLVRRWWQRRRSREGPPEGLYKEVGDHPEPAHHIHLTRLNAARRSGDRLSQPADELDRAPCQGQEDDRGRDEVYARDDQLGADCALQAPNPLFGSMWSPHRKRRSTY